MNSHRPIRLTHASNITYAYHRNGIAGTPFYAVTFDWEFNPSRPLSGRSSEPSPRASDRRPFVAVWFCEFDSEGDLTGATSRFAAFEIGALPNIQFGQNSWRGDHFAEEICPWIIERESEAEMRPGRVA